MIKECDILVWTPQHEEPEGQTQSEDEEDEKEVKERVLWVQDDILVTIFMSGPTWHDPGNMTLPFVQQLSAITGLIDKGLIAVSSDPDPFAYVLTYAEEYKKLHQDSQSARWVHIQSIVSQEPSVLLSSEARGLLISKAAKKHNCSEAYLYKWIKRYWIAGKQANVLYGELFRCGHIKKGERFKQSKTPKEIKDVIWDGIDKHRGQGRTVKQLQTEIAREDIFRQPIPGKRRMLNPDSAPKIHVVRYIKKRVDSRDVIRALIKDIGYRRYKNKCRPLKGGRRRDLGPGDIYQIDATIGDIYLVSSLCRDSIIGRPVPYFTVDAYSHLITGIHVGLEGPLWEDGAAMALLNAFSPKLPFLEKLPGFDIICEHLGVVPDDNLWPADCVCRGVLGDFEMLKEKAKAPVMPLELAISIARPYEAYGKAIVEHQFKVSQDSFVTWAPGSVNLWRDEVRQRGHKYDAVLTLEEFMSILVCWVLHWNNNHLIEGFKLTPAMVRDHLPKNPRQIWWWGMENQTGMPRQYPRDLIHLALLPRKLAPVTQSGVINDDLRYIPQMPHADPFLVQAGLKSFEVEVSYNSRDNSQILMHMPGDKGAVKCLLHPDDARTFGGYSEKEVLLRQYLERGDHRAHWFPDLQSRVNVRDAGDEIISGAYAEREAKRLGAVPTMKDRGNIPVNRQNEIDSRRENTEWPEFSDDGPNTSTPLDENSDHDNSSFGSSEEALSDELRRLRRGHD